MIKAILLDCDGVLLITKQIHYESLNEALRTLAKSYVISYDDHIANFDGRPSKTKLEILNKRGLDPSLNDKIWKLKQDYTCYFVEKLINPDDYEVQIECLRRLKENGYKLACVSNSIRLTLELMLKRAGYLEYLDLVVSNEDIRHPKPSPAPYLHTFIELDLAPRECIIVEDSEVGLKSAYDSGGMVIKVESPKDVTYDLICLHKAFWDSYA